MSNFTIRRCEILDAYVASTSVGNGHAQGIYLAGGTKNTTIEQNVIDHNGWKENVSGAGPTEFNHDIYVNTGVTGTIIRGNTISRPSLCGITMRSAATISDNLFLRCPVGIKAGGGACTISGNVILDGTDLGTTGGGATGIEVTSSSGVSISNNIIAHELSTAKYHVTGIRIDGGVTNLYRLRQSHLRLATSHQQRRRQRHHDQKQSTHAPTPQRRSSRKSAARTPANTTTPATSIRPPAAA